MRRARRGAGSDRRFCWKRGGGAMNAAVALLADDAVAPPEAGRRSQSAPDEELLDAYSRAVTGAAEKVGPAGISREGRHPGRPARPPAPVGPRTCAGIVVSPSGFLPHDSPA